MNVELISSVRCFNGWENIYKHRSLILDCDMTFGAYVPDHSMEKQLPGLVYLSGLTCTHANVMEKAGFQRLASMYGMIIVHPDTSPRGVDIPGDSDSWDFGKSAGFYVDALVEPWSKHYKMYSYITKELLEVVTPLLRIDINKLGIFGHSMGGHGAIMIGLRNPHLFKSISAFAPICHPTVCAWGKKAFAGYLGSDEKVWEQYDSSILIKSYVGPAREILIDQGEDDSFLVSGQLMPETLKTFGQVQVKTRVQPKYDHSYYFIATFIEDHFKHHKEILMK